MSDSDDTDILLLIPPNFFITHVEEVEFAGAAAAGQHSNRNHQLLEDIRAGDLLNAQFDAWLEHEYTQFCSANNAENAMSAASSDALAMPPPTAAYQFLAPNRKAELNHINARLHTLEHEAECQFAAPSDVSTISHYTQVGAQQRPLGVAHSTPKRGVPKDSRHNQNDGQEGVLLEIDNFLGEREHERAVWSRGDGERRSWQQPRGQQQRSASGLDAQEVLANSLPDGLNQLPEDRLQRVRFEGRTTPLDANLISLSEMWGKSGQGTAIACGTQTTLREEQLRRQHLERTVHSLQSRLLEYQQRLSVAVEVDRTKDAALNNAQFECKSLDAEVQKLRDALNRLEFEHKEHNSKMEALQRELAQAVSLAAKFQDKNEKLESELLTSTRKSSECTNMYKQQVEELEIKMHGCKRSEEFALNELNKLKDKLAKVDYHSEKLKVRCDELEKDCTTLKHQKEMLQEFHQKQKSRADALEVHKKSLQETLATLTENERTLKRKIELQAKSLKTHYQQQLENVVSQKLKEFQEQLDKTEEQLKSEARERERLLADRAVKQLELINEKNELELNLLQEKQNEEVELYRIQLANASKKIDDLEQKLNLYKTKRADIAEKLHGVMEAQWQKALEILTSPNNQQRPVHTDTDAESPEDNEKQSNKAKEDGNYETPKTSKTLNKHANARENNLNCSDERKAQVEPMDRLQAYIELLLSKSPSDFEKLDEILALTKSRTGNGKLEKSAHKRTSSGKPPWRA